jgi:DNA-binding NtrC family response regulator
VLLVRSSRAGTNELASELESQQFQVTVAPSAQIALMELTAREYPLILLDLVDVGGAESMAGAGARENGADDAPVNEGLRALREIRRVSPVSQVVVLVCGRLDLPACCQAVRYGAASFVEWTPGQGVESIVDRLTQAMGRYEAAVEEGRQLHTRQIFDETGVPSQSQIMAKLLFQAKRAAVISDAPILITGESGTGKQLLAEAIHRMDPKRRNKPFLTVNCAAITGSLAESALFGHRKGAFTGATEDRPGYFRAAHGGTLLLDEVSELERSLQPKLLRVLQEGLVMPVGDHREYPVDVRIIAACNRPLPILVEQNEFRLDLYQRLNVISLNVPPLRDRPGDIPLLVQFFLKRYASYYPHPIESVDPEVYEVLSRSIGSGNVRELENAVRQILALKTSGTRLELSDIPAHLLEKNTNLRTEEQVTESLASAAIAVLRSGRLSLVDMLDEVERMILREALANSSCTHADLARQLGLSRRTFYNKLKKYDLSS